MLYRDPFRYSGAFSILYFFIFYFSYSTKLPSADIIWAFYKGILFVMVKLSPSLPSDNNESNSDGEDESSV